MSDLLGRESRVRPKVHTAHFCRDPARAGAFDDKGPLEIGHSGEYGQHHAPGGHHGIGRVCGSLYLDVFMESSSCDVPRKFYLSTPLNLQGGITEGVKSRAMLTPRGVVFASKTDPSDVFMSAFFLRPLTGRGDILGDDRGGFDWRYPAGVF